MVNTKLNCSAILVHAVVCYITSVLPRPQASLLGGARWALGYGIDSAQFARRYAIDANEKSNGASRSATEPSSLAPPVFTQQRLGTRLTSVRVGKGTVCMLV